MFNMYFFNYSQKQKRRVHVRVKKHQNKPQIQILTSWDRTPVLKIPGSATIYNMILNEYSLEKRCAPVRSYFKYKHWGHYDTATPIKINIDLRSPWYLEYEKLPLQKTIPRGVLYFSPSPSLVYKSFMLFIFILDGINHGTITPTMGVKRFKNLPPILRHVMFQFVKPTNICII